MMRTKVALWFVGLLPHWVVYWCGIKLASHATTGEYSDQIVPELGMMDALRRWGKP